MSNANASLLNHKYLNGGYLWGLIATAISLIVIIPLSQLDMANPANVSEMIQNSVRTAVPWLFVAFAASSLVKLFPNTFTKWILRNRRLFGLCFAVGMAWQLFFILWFLLGSFDYYMEEAYNYYDLSEQIPGYLIIFAMTFTSFKFGRDMISPKQWKFLHKGGIYFLWAVLWSTYWFELYYYEDIQTIDYVYYWMGIIAWGLRLGAWVKQRKSKQKPAAVKPQLLLFLLKLFIAGPLAGLGVAMISFGNSWAPPVLGFLSHVSFGGWIELVIPFISVGLIIIAANVAVRAPR